MSKHATADFRQNRFKSHHHFDLENENFAQNPLILPTQFKALSRSCCLYYRRQIFPSFAVSLSFKMKCLTHFLSLAHKNSFFKTLRVNEWCGDNTEDNICFDLNLHSLTIQVKHASCVSEACDVIFAFVLRLKVQLHIQLLKMRSKYSHGICHFNPRKMVCLRFFTVRHWNAELSPRLSTNA